jgi:hypothetical protein
MGLKKEVSAKLMEKKKKLNSNFGAKLERRKECAQSRKLCLPNERYR